MAPDRRRLSNSEPDISATEYLTHGRQRRRLVLQMLVEKPDDTCIHDRVKRVTVETLGVSADFGRLQ